MKLRRIEVRDFRKLGHVVIDELGDGLNVIVGDNEAGKSTLLAALRAALFERHRVGGAAAAAMQPYNQSVRPEVLVEFERGGAIWTLRKAFCQRQEAELSGNGERYTGDAVEEKLAEMFGFTPASSGGTKPQEHHGVFGLLWVEQGMSHRQLGIGAGRNHLASALEREIGQVTGGERGRALLAAAEARREQFWDRRGNARGEFKALAVQLGADRQQFADLKRRMAEHDERVSKLAGIQNILARYRRDDTLEASRKRAAAARQAAAAVAGLEEALRATEGEVERARLKLDAATTRNAARRKLVADLAADQSALDAARVARDEALAALARLDAVAAETATRLDAATQAERQATSRLRGMEQALARRQAAQAVERLTGQLKLAEQADDARRKALAFAQAATLTAEDIAGLEKLERAVEQARMRLEAASVRITLHPQGAQAAHLDGKPVEAGTELSLSRDTRLFLEGYGEIGIHPGGGTEELVQAAEQARQTLDKALRRLELADVAAARAALRQQEAARAEVKAHGATLAALAPAGIEALRQELARNALLAEGGEAEACEPADIEAARRECGEAAAALRAIEAEAKERGAAVETARRELAVLEERVSVAEARCAKRQEELAAARAEADDRTLEEDCVREDQAFRQAEQARAAAQSALAGADPEAKQLALKQAEQSEREIQADINRLDNERREIEAALRALGRDGLGEQLAQLEGQIALSEARLKAMTLEAEAARLLHATLADAQRETKDRWLAPVRERSAPYLRLIQADSDIVLHDETFEIEQLVRNGVAEPFGGLSVGAREQIAVITRIALADILREAGQEACIVLDDALVNTDEERLERMHLVLGKAAQNQQVLVLTCRERDFLQLGAPIRRM
ncbi:AAA family ATPase [Mesorhizobium sp. KR2-14]|uniref:AAA family ATPase n=1 Tax=Mesorhizobium sp. KR2-14 TaxID=3156610 RepID=UPI0032B38643